MRQYGQYEYQYQGNQHANNQSRQPMYGSQTELPNSAQSVSASNASQTTPGYSSYSQQPYGQNKPSYSTGHVEGDPVSSNYSGPYYNGSSTTSTAPISRSEVPNSGYSSASHSQNYLSGTSDATSNQYPTQASRNEAPSTTPYQYNADPYRTASPANVSSASRAIQAEHSASHPRPSARNTQYASSSSDTLQETQSNYSRQFNSAPSVAYQSSSTLQGSQSHQSPYPGSYSGSSQTHHYYPTNISEQSPVQQNTYNESASQADYRSSHAATALQSLQSTQPSHSASSAQQNTSVASRANVLPPPQTQKSSHSRSSTVGPRQSPALNAARVHQRTNSGTPPTAENHAPHVANVASGAQSRQRNYPKALSTSSGESLPRPTPTPASVLHTAHSQQHNPVTQHQDTYTTVNPNSVIRVPPHIYRGGSASKVHDTSQLSASKSSFQTVESHPHPQNSQILAQNSATQTAVASQPGSTTPVQEPKTSVKPSTGKKPSQPRQRKKKAEKANESGTNNADTINAPSGSASAAQADKPDTPKKKSKGGKANAKKDAPKDDATEIKALMAKMRELNSRNPDLLAQMWQQEHKKDVCTTQQPNTVSDAQARQQSKAPDQLPNSKGDAPATQAPRLVSPSIHQPGAAPHANMSKTITGPRRPPSVPEKQSQLAQTAARYFNSFTENTSKQLSVQELLSFLHKNPTYIELCEWIEGKGVKVDRYAFARVLRPAVGSSPAEEASQSRQPSQEINHIPGHTRQLSDHNALPTAQLAADYVANSEKPGTKHEPAIQHFVNGHWQQNNTHIRTSPSTDQTRRVPSVAFMTSPVPTTRGAGIPAERPNSRGPTLFANIAAKTLQPASKPPFMDKAGAARKRTFKDLIDMTALSDDEDEPPEPPPKKQAVAPPGYEPALEFSAPIGKQQGNKDPHIVDYMLPADLIKQGHQEGPVHAMDKSPHLVSSHPPDSSHTPPQNNQNSAPQRPVPPVLKSSVIPSQPPPQPQQPQRPEWSMPPNVPWHAPGVPPLPPAHKHFVTNDIVRELDVVRPLDKRQALRRHGYNIKTIARDVLIATGKHPDMRPLNAHLDGLKREFYMVEANSDLSSFRWDLVDPGGFQPEITGWDEEDEIDEDKPVRAPHVRRLIGAEGGVLSPIVAAPHAMHANTETLNLVNTPVKKRRGRPPRMQSQVTPSLPDRQNFGQIHGQSSTSHQIPQSSHGRTSVPSASAHQSTIRSTGSRTPSVSGDGSLSYKALRAAMEAAGHSIPRRGRPPGWRKSMMQSRPSPAPAGTVKPVPPSEPDASSMNFLQYKCEWNGCNTELHNLDTLRKHVYKLHRNEAEKSNWSCFWSDCGKRNETGDVLTRHYFNNEGLYKSHMEALHFTPLAWKKGDGPKAGVSDPGTDSEAYLSDSHGRRVTPMISTATTVDRAIPIVRGPGRPRRTIEQDARDLFEARQRRARMIGPGVDRSGSKIVNEKRRMGFLDDNEEEVILEEEDE